MKRVKTFMALVVFCTMLLFCSCDTLFSNNSDSLISPPVLFPQQQQIMNALTNSVGDKISLEYPQTGKNRSAFVLFDLDGDSVSEAIAFYRLSADDVINDTVHINILKNDTSLGWTSVCDIVGEASAIDRVSVANFKDTAEIIIGWDVIRENQRTLVCYSLKGNVLSRDYTAPYIEFAVADFYAENEGDELITVNFSKEKELAANAQHAKLIVKESGGFAVKSTAPLDFRVTGYKTCLAGKYNEKDYAFFLDGVIDTEKVNSQILIVDSKGQLLNPLVKDNVTAEDNIRKSTLLTQDINGDGIYEVPHQEAVTGYGDVPESERIYKTVFKTLSNGELKKSLVMYISPFGVRIGINEKLDGNVTIKPDFTKNEIVFYEFNKTLADSTNMLFSVKVSEKEGYEQIEGYDILKSTDYTVVSVNVADGGNELCPSWSLIYESVEII